jgi:hypothetical protein
VDVFRILGSLRHETGMRFPPSRFGCNPALALGATLRQGDLLFDVVATLGNIHAGQEAPFW